MCKKKKVLNLLNQTIHFTNPHNIILCDKAYSIFYTRDCFRINSYPNDNNSYQNCRYCVSCYIISTYNFAMNIQEKKKLIIFNSSNDSSITYTQRVYFVFYHYFFLCEIIIIWNHIYLIFGIIKRLVFQTEVSICYSNKANTNHFVKDVG